MNSSTKYWALSRLLMKWRPHPDPDPDPEPLAAPPTRPSARLPALTCSCDYRKAQPSVAEIKSPFVASVPSQ